MKVANVPRSVLNLAFERTVLWIVHRSWRMALVSLGLGVCTFLTEYVVHLAVVGRRSAFSGMTDAFVLGSISAAFTMFVLSAARDRHRKVQDDLRRIADLNHRIRNALQVIVYGEASRLDCEGRKAVLDGVDKIDSTLKEIFPLLGERRGDRPWEAYNKAQLIKREIHLPVKDRRNKVF